MSQYCALWLVVFGISFVLLFDNVHVRNRSNRLLRSMNLMSHQELNQLLSIWSACED
jgi:hypothetical protein